ncbi:hypothetical protein [Apilactobacillus timberlakei]|uniref:Phage holin n=1 Tax=Apilactobacillus timberlakei TaxID=2008380 RepID=A0ABY2YSD0_9LACO|nr:hypothetical protein [Apilactobacillus timberlakei]TPR12409.1 hypothetical protein DY048_07615 [Apilactobacillus timberlakei]TPR12995.1 hypothetical protein DY052_08775 [Apilactobacillus timberlakei]
MDLTVLLSQLDKGTPLYYVVLTVFVLTQLYKYLHNAKLDKQMKVVSDKAKQIVIPIANMTGLANADRRAKAVDMLYNWAVAHKIKISRNNAAHIIDFAYHYCKNQGWLNDKQPVTTGNPEDLTPEQLDNMTPDK